MPCPQRGIFAGYFIYRQIGKLEIRVMIEGWSRSAGDIQFRNKN